MCEVPPCAQAQAAALHTVCVKPNGGICPLESLYRAPSFGSTLFTQRAVFLSVWPDFVCCQVRSGARQRHAANLMAGPASSLGGVTKGAGAGPDRGWGAPTLPWSQ